MNNQIKEGKIYETKDISKLDNELLSIIKEESYDRTQKAKIHDKIMTHITKNYEVYKK